MDATRLGLDEPTRTWRGVPCMLARDERPRTGERGEPNTSQCGDKGTPAGPGSREALTTQQRPRNT